MKVVISHKNPKLHFLTIYSQKGRPPTYKARKPMSIALPGIIFAFSFGLAMDKGGLPEPKIVYILGIIYLGLFAGYLGYLVDKTKKFTSFEIDAVNKSIKKLGFHGTEIYGIKKVMISRTPYKKRKTSSNLFLKHLLKKSEFNENIESLHEQAQYDYYFKWDAHVLDKNDNSYTIFTLESKNPLKYYEGFIKLSKGIAKILRIPLIDDTSKTRIVYEQNEIQLIPDKKFSPNSHNTYSDILLNELDYRVEHIRIMKKETMEKRSLTIRHPFSFKCFFLSSVLIPYLIINAIFSIYLFFTSFILPNNYKTALSSVIALLIGFMFSMPFIYSGLFFNYRLVLILDKKTKELSVYKNKWFLVTKKVFPLQEVLVVNHEIISNDASFLEIILPFKKIGMSYGFQDPVTNNAIYEEIKYLCSSYRFVNY